MHTPHIFNRRRDGIDGLNNYFAVCEKANVPYVYAETRQKYCDVFFDFISLSEDKRKALTNNRDTVVNDAIAIFMRHSCNKSRYEISSLLISMLDMPIAQANACTQELLSLISGITER